jgi:hypothetical protein
VSTEPLHVELLPMTEWPVTFALVPDVADEFVAHVYALDAGNGSGGRGCRLDELRERKHALLLHVPGRYPV